MTISTAAIEIILLLGLVFLVALFVVVLPHEMRFYVKRSNGDPEYLGNAEVIKAIAKKEEKSNGKL